MASVNIAEWTPDQVADWLSGLGPSVERYAAGLRARGLDGARLLMLRCDDLEYFGVNIIGHQELLLEAVEHLRDFHYECRRECVQQLAMRVSQAGSCLARALRAHDALDTQTLADVARLVKAVKPLVCWLERWPLCAQAGLGARRLALLQVSLEAATSAQRDRFAEQPARTVAASAQRAAAAADYIVQDVCAPCVLAPAGVVCVSLRQGARPLGLALAPSHCRHQQLAHIRFGSPAHASGALHVGDEIVQVGGQCVVGWDGEAILGLCRAVSAGGGAGGGGGGGGCGARGGELQLRVRRRGARPPPARLAAPPPPPSPRAASSESDDSAPLSPPASPTQLDAHHDRTRMYPPKPRCVTSRRHSVSGGSPVASRHQHNIEQFWRELKEQQCIREGDDVASQPLDCALYRRDKAVSCSTGLELSPRPRTCLGVAPPPPPPVPPPPPPGAPERRGKLDKAHSTPAYDPGAAGGGGGGGGGGLPADPIPECPHTPPTPADSPPAPDKADQILDFKKSSSQIGEAILAGQRARPEAVNAALLERAEALARSSSVEVVPEPPPRPAPPPSPAPDFPALRIVPRYFETNDRNLSPLKARPEAPVSARLCKADIRVVSAPRAALPALNQAPPPAPAPAPAPAPDPPPAHPHPAHPVQPSSSTSGTRHGIFPSAKTRSLKKKNSLLAKRRAVSWRTLSSHGAVCAGAGGGGGCEGAGAGGAVCQRVRPRGAAASRWVQRHLLLTHNLLYAYRSPECARASCMINLSGFTVSGAPEVKSRPHAFKVYHTGVAFYFAASSRDALLGWLQLLHRATLAAPADILDLSKQFSETEYSETESDGEAAERPQRSDDRDKGKFGSLKKLRSRVARWESGEAVSAASLDRTCLRIFSRHRAKDDRPKSKPCGVPVPTSQYRSYRRVPPPAPPAAPPPAAASPDLAWGLAKGHDQDNFKGFVTLEEFMLKKQEEENRQVYTNRVLMGIERVASGQQKELQKQLERIIPDVIYGELPTDSPSAATSTATAPVSSTAVAGRALPAAPSPPVRAPVPGPKPISIKGKDGYEKIVYPEGAGSSPERRRDSLRRNDKVQPGAALSPLAPDSWSVASSGGVSRLRLMFSARRDPPEDSASTPTRSPAAGGGGGGGRGAVYPHLQCPPTFQAETYCLALAALPPAAPHSPHSPHSPHQ